MQIEDYFEFDPTGEIKIKGHRIWLEDVLYEHIFREMTPSELLIRFPTLTLEKIHACLLYYHANQARLDQYLADYLEYTRTNRVSSERENHEQLADLRQRMDAYRDQIRLVPA